MGHGKDFDYRKLLRDLEELRFRGGRLYAERVTAAYGGGSSTGEWTPAVDLYEEGECYYLVAEVAGVNQSDVALEVAERVLTLRGLRPFSAKGISSENYYRMECSYGSFERSFTLPKAVDEDGVEALLKDGVLTVRLPHVSEAGRRRIQVNGS
jgi:HSP20 family protein